MVVQNRIIIKWYQLNGDLVVSVWTINLMVLNQMIIYRY